MWKSFVLLLCLSGYCLAGPVGTKRNMPIVQQRDEASAAVSSMESETAAVAEPELTIMSTLTLPSNATSIRADITDGFSCVNKTYGYYADVDNDCQIFHVCLPVTYADGKENTFRWSFICPEETIFSQDSFTCMRPDDMAISCDESFQYYELNRNFGMVESNKENNEMNSESENSEPNETVMAAETQREPVVQEQEELETSKPVQQAVKVQKPNRRKPGVSYSSQKKPNNSLPLRKMPQIQPVMPEMNDNGVGETKNEIEKPVQEEEIKFSRRPVQAVTNALKDKIENSKPEAMAGIRTQFFNHNRKRPSMFNKKPVEFQELKPEMVPIQVESQPEQQTFYHLESNMSNNNAETQVADSENQASENNEVIIKPEQTIENDASMTHEDSNKVEEVKTVEVPTEKVTIEEPQLVLEAFEEIPAVIAEVLETQSGSVPEEEELKLDEQLPNAITEKIQVAAEPPSAEVSQKPEEQTVVDMQTAEDSETSEASQSIDEQQAHEDHLKSHEESQVDNKIEVPQPVEEVQYVENVKPEEILYVEEPQPVEPFAPLEDIQTPAESPIVEENPIVVEEKPVQPELYPASEELVKTHTVAQPAIFENSEEGLTFTTTQTIEEMEDERPADAPESMQATEEMSHQGSNVQQMMDDLEDNKHSIGGFKPVDPVMAHEAEQLIADFINTLRNNDFTNETPGMIRHQYNSKEPEKEQEKAQDNVSVVEEADKMESNEVTKEEATKVLDKTDKLKDSVKSNEEVKEETQPEVVEVQDLFQENNAEEMEDAREEAQTLSQENIEAEIENIKEQPQALSQANNVEEMEDTKEETSKIQPETMENNNNQESIALKFFEAQTSENIEQSPKPDKQKTESSNMMVMTNMPEEMYQIPVQVISEPEEDMPNIQQESQGGSEAASENKSIVMNVSTKDKLEEEVPAVMMGGNKPISIDDIVELVKERLDHMPKDEMETPMQLEQVLGDMHDEKVSEDKIETEVGVEEATKPAQSEEDIVMPIYQRTVQPLKVEAETQEHDLPIEHSESSVDATDVKEKSNRSYRSRSMLTPKLNSRKRLFLFKSDKNKSS